jgi:hypothetical protein
MIFVIYFSLCNPDDLIFQFGMKSYFPKAISNVDGDQVNEVENRSNCEVAGGWEQQSKNKCNVAVFVVKPK